MQAPLRLGYVTAMWGRPQLTGKVFRAVADLRRRLAPALDLVPAVCGSEGARSRQLAEDCGFMYVERPNEPLGAKWNAALDLLRTREVAGVCVFGSDDLANAAYVEALRAAIAAGCGLAGLTSLYFLDGPRGRLLHWRGYPADAGRTVGAGRFIHARILDALDWKLWPDAYNRGLDGAMQARLAAAGHDTFHILPCGDGGPVVMDIKGQGGMNTFESMAACAPCTLLGRPRQFLERNFGHAAAAAFLPGAEAPGPDGCADCAVGLPDAAPEAAAEPGPAIWHIPQEPPTPGSLDFLLACRAAGVTVHQRGIAAFLGQPEPPAGDFVFGDLDGETLMAMLRPGPGRLLDAREITDPHLGALAARLPVTAIGGAPSDSGTLPLPWSRPRGFPCFAQRAHVVACLTDAEEQAALAAAWRAGGGGPQAGLFLTDPAPGLGAAGDGIEYLDPPQVFPCRQLFRVLIFSGGAFAARASHFLAGATPGVCLGPLPAELEGCAGVRRAETVPEALSLCRILLARRRYWEKSATALADLGARENARFTAALRALLGGAPQNRSSTP